MLQQVQLVPKRGFGTGIFGDIFHDLDQGFQHFRNSGSILENGHPLDRIQSIVQKVGADLRLQIIELQTALLLFRIQLLLYQLGNLTCHHIDFASNITELIRCFQRGVCGKLSVRDPL